MMKKESNKTCYGLESVEKANQLKAIGTLYVSNELCRSDHNGIRRNYIDLVESVKKSEGKVIVFSSNHVMGEELNRLNGVCCYS